MFSLRVLTLFFAILNVKVGNGQRINEIREPNLNEIEIELIEGKSLSHFLALNPFSCSKNVYQMCEFTDRESRSMVYVTYNMSVHKL